MLFTRVSVHVCPYVVLAVLWTTPPTPQHCRLLPSCLGVEYRDAVIIVESLDLFFLLRSLNIKFSGLFPGRVKSRGLGLVGSPIMTQLRPDP